MKRLIAILLFVTIIFSFSACSGKDTKNPHNAYKQETANAHLPFVGTWKCTLPLEVALIMNGFDISDLFGEYSAEEVGCNATLNLYLELSEDKTGSLIQKGTEFDIFFLEVYRDYYTFISDYGIATELYGMTEANLDKNAHDRYSVSTWPEAMDKAFEEIEQEALEAPASDSVSEIIYSVSEDILTITYTADSTEESFELKDNKLVCNRSDNIEGDLSGYTFSKVEIPEKLTEEYLSGTWTEMITLEDLTALSGKTPTENFNSLLSPYGITLSDLGMVVPNNIPIKYIITFEDGKTTQSVQAISYFEFLDKFYSSLATYMSNPDIFASNFIEGGIEELERLCEEQGITVAEYMEDEIENIRTLGKQTQAQMEENFAQGEYTLTDTKVTVTSDVDSVEYSYSIGKLITESEGLELVFQKDITA